jgi:hypothetical protein
VPLLVWGKSHFFRELRARAHKKICPGQHRCFLRGPMSPPDNPTSRKGYPGPAESFQYICAVAYGNGAQFFAGGRRCRRVGSFFSSRQNNWQSVPPLCG